MHSYQHALLKPSSSNKQSKAILCSPMERNLILSHKRLQGKFTERKPARKSYTDESEEKKSKDR